MIGLLLPANLGNPLWSRFQAGHGQTSFDAASQQSHRLSNGDTGDVKLETQRSSPLRTLNALAYNCLQGIYRST